MMTPRDKTGRRQAGQLVNTLTEGGPKQANENIFTLETQIKPLEPKFYSVQKVFTPSDTGLEYDSKGRGYSRKPNSYNPPITSTLLATHSGTLSAAQDKPAPSAPKPLSLPQPGRSNSPEVIGGAVSTPTPTPFTPAPAVEYRNLCEYHAGLTRYIEREAPEMRATGQHEALEELEALSGAMLDRMGELEMLGAHLGSAGVHS